MTMMGTLSGLTLIDILEVGRIIPVTPGDPIEIVGDVEVEGDFCVRPISDSEGICLQYEYVNSNTSSRVFWRESTNGATGFSAIYVGSANPTLGGTDFTLGDNAFYFIRHDSSETGVVVWSVPRDSNTVTFAGDVGMGALSATTGTFSGAAVSVGVQHTEDGRLSLYGDGAGSILGGRVLFYLPKDHDTN